MGSTFVFFCKFLTYCCKTAAGAAMGAALIKYLHITNTLFATAVFLGCVFSFIKYLEE